MDLELSRKQFDCYRAEVPLVLTIEEAAESIVPDRSPDAARIVDVSACLQLRSQTIADGRLVAAGTVKMTVLYVAEDVPGIRTLDCDVPFEHSAKLPDGCKNACVEGRICDSEVRLMNPRKLYIRVNIDWRITPYLEMSFTTCGEIIEEKRYAIQTLCEAYDVSLIRAVQEDEFAFSDEMTIPGGREIAELLCSRAKLRVTEAKALGSKIVLKGVACVSLLYATGDGTLCAYAEELPFSQLFDAETEYDESSVSASLSLSECEIHTADDRIVQVRLHLNAFFTLRSTEHVFCITDLYSTVFDLDAQLDTVSLPQEPQTVITSQSVREQIETGTEVKSVLAADVCFGSVGVRQDGDMLSLRASATLSALYLDEADTPLSVHRRIEVTAETNANGEAQATLENVCAGDVTATVNASGIELRFPADFTLVSMKTEKCECLSELSAEPMQMEDDAPSLVLRALDEGETLWDVAKQYRTTAETILSANELTESSLLEAGSMLLIPRSR